MNNKVSTLITLVLVSCSIQTLAAPPTVISKLYESLKPKPSKDQPFPRACYLGTDCLALDSHPFEVCQLGSKDCGGQQPELLLVGPTAVAVKPVKAR
jgi:hypothetical protein